MLKDQVVGKFIGGFFGALGACIGTLAFDYVRKEMKKADEERAIADAKAGTAAAV